MTSAVTEQSLLANVASIICEETCGLTSECKSREAAKALYDKGWLRPLSPSARAEAGEAEQIIVEFIRLADLGFEDSMKEPEESGNFAVYERAKRFLAAPPAVAEQAEVMRKALLPFEVIANHPFLENVSDSAVLFIKDMHGDYVGSLTANDFRQARAALSKEGR